MPLLPHCYRIFCFPNKELELAQRMQGGGAEVARRWRGVGAELVRSWQGVGKEVARRWRRVGAKLARKLALRWRIGTYLGVVNSSNEHYVGVKRHQPRD